MQCTVILLVHENNTWQNSTANEGFNLLGGAVWILPGVDKILATLLSTSAFATDERGMARVLTLSCILQRARWRQARTSCVFYPTTPPEPPADQPATRKLCHPTVAGHIMTATQPTGRNSRKNIDKLIFHINNDGNHIKYRIFTQT